MAKVTVITDSIACLPRDMREQYGIMVMPIHFYHGGREYTDGVDITPSEAYQLFLKDPDSFKTSGISPGECLEIYRQAARKSDKILCVTISSRLSAVHQVALSTRELLLSEQPGLSIEVIDSRNVAAAEGFVVLAVARRAAEGKEMVEVVRSAGIVRDKVNLVALMDTVRYVYRTGRIPKMAARVGSVLNIRPLFTISSGVPHFIGAVRSREHGIDRLIKMVGAKVGHNPVHIAVMHAYTAGEAEKLKERVRSELNCAELWVCEFSPIMGYAAGTGLLGLAFYTES